MRRGREWRRARPVSGWLAREAARSPHGAKSIRAEASGPIRTRSNGTVPGRKIAALSTRRLRRNWRLFALRSTGDYRNCHCLPIVREFLPDRHRPIPRRGEAIGILAPSTRRDAGRELFQCDACGTVVTLIAPCALTVARAAPPLGIAMYDVATPPSFVSGAAGENVGLITPLPNVTARPSTRPPPSGAPLSCAVVWTP